MSSTIRQSRVSTNRAIGAAVAVLLAAAIAACAASSGALQAAEIQLHGECRGENPLVTLGDLATIYTSDAVERRRLETIDIVPTPSVGSRRYVEVREIQNILRSRGVNLLEHRFSGSSRVLLLGAGEAASPIAERPLTSSAVESAARAVRQAIQSFLARQDPAGGPWIIDVTLDDTQSRLVMEARRAVAVQGGRAPWVGPQSFEVTVGPANAARRFLLQAAVSLPPEAVVAVRALPRGIRIAPADVRLQPMSETGLGAAPFSSLRQVVGQETTRTIAAGKVMEPNMMRAPLLVRRGEMVRVISEGGGVRVTVTGKAREDGGLDDLITVETLDRKNTFRAQVCGPQQARVFPLAVQVRPATPLARSHRGDVRLLQHRDRSR